MIKKSLKKIAVLFMASMVFGGSLWAENFITALDITNQLMAIDEAKKQNSHNPEILAALSLTASKLQNLGDAANAWDASGKDLTNNYLAIDKLDALIKKVSTNSNYSGQLKKFDTEMNKLLSQRAKLVANNEALKNSLKKINKIGDILDVAARGGQLVSLLHQFNDDVDNGSVGILEVASFATNVSKTTLGILPGAGTVFDVADAVVYGIDKSADIYGEYKRDEALSDAQDMQNSINYLNNRLRVQTSIYAKEGLSEEKFVENYKKQIQDTIQYIKGNYEEKSQGSILIPDDFEISKKNYDRAMETLNMMLADNSPNLQNRLNQFHEYVGTYEAIEIGISSSEDFISNMQYLKEIIKEDPNKEKLASLKEKDKELKDKIKDLNEKKQELKTKESLLSEKEKAFNRLNEIDRESDEFKEAFKDYILYRKQYDSLLAEISDLIALTESYEFKIGRLQNGINTMMENIEDTVDDYLNGTKVDIADNAQQSSIPYKYFLGGYVTFNSEDKSTGNLRYWGGNFGSTLSDLASGGHHILNSSTNYESSDGTVEDIHFSHGTNTATDNTKEHIISASEMTASNMNNLNVSKTNSGNTLNVKTTGHYNYTAWGEWSQTGGLYTDANGGTGTEQMAMHNNWIAGQSTPDLPKTGSATYSGRVDGHWYQNSVGSSYGGKIIGTMNMTVDFTNTNVVAGSLNLRKSTGAAFATATMDQMTINRANSGFAGKLVGVDIMPAQALPTNSIAGQFNGPNAEEVGGNWNVSKTNGEFASGTFAGKR